MQRVPHPHSLVRHTLWYTSDLGMQSLAISGHLYSSITPSEMVQHFLQPHADCMTSSRAKQQV